MVSSVTRSRSVRFIIIRNKTNDFAMINQKQTVWKSQGENRSRLEIFFVLKQKRYTRFVSVRRVRVLLRRVLFRIDVNHQHDETVGSGRNHLRYIATM